MQSLVRSANAFLLSRLSVAAYKPTMPEERHCVHRTVLPQPAYCTTEPHLDRRTEWHPAYGECLAATSVQGCQDSPMMPLATQPAMTQQAGSSARSDGTRC